MAETGYILQYGQPAQVVKSGTTKYLYDVTGKQLQRWGSDSSGNVVSTALSGIVSGTQANFTAFYDQSSVGTTGLSINCTSNCLSASLPSRPFKAIGVVNSGNYTGYWEANQIYSQFQGTSNASNSYLTSLAVASISGGQCTGTFTRQTGLFAFNQMASPNSPSYTAAFGVDVTPFQFLTGGTGTITSAAGIRIGVPTLGSGAVGVYYGLQIDSAALSGSTTNAGLRVTKPTGATNNFAIWLTDTTGSADGGITWGGTSGACNLYRSGTNTIKSDTDICPRHYYSNTGLPSVGLSTGAGTSPTLTNFGNDQGGFLNLTTGTTPTANAIVLTLTYTAAFTGSASYVSLTPANANAAALSGTGQVYVTTTNGSSFSIKAGLAALAGSTVYQWYYTVAGK